MTVRFPTVELAAPAGDTVTEPATDETVTVDGSAADASPADTAQTVRVDNCDD